MMKMPLALSAKTAGEIEAALYSEIETADL